MLEIYLNNQQDRITIDEDLEHILRRVVQRVMEQESTTGPGELSITLVDDADIHELNRIYRQIDRVTDVLSFPADDLLTDLEPDAPRIWGDVVISMERAAAQAEEYGHSLVREVSFLVVHGVLHLLGFDHANEADAEIMEKKGEQVLQSLRIDRKS
jgi:probable rRNA maturation factor